MFRQGPLPIIVHAASEPLLAALLVLAPFLFGFDDLGAPTALSIVAGILLLVVAMSTRWRLSLVKVIPLAGHAITDVVLGAFLVASPFLFGFKSDSDAATAFFIAFGLLLILATLATRWSADQQVAARERRTPAAPSA